ncbi:MAG: hypothetical protein ACE5H4_14350 [Candidatus Thorarchaeota archaeon]
MSESSRRGEPIGQIELDILRSFGWTVVELESTLYERYLRISAVRSLITLKDFRAHLREMEAMGYISREKLLGKRAYRRLLVEEDLSEPIHPKAPLDEMRLAIGSLRARIKEWGKKRSRLAESRMPRGSSE